MTDHICHYTPCSAANLLGSPDSLRFFALALLGGSVSDQTEMAKLKSPTLKRVELLDFGNPCWKF